MINLLSKLLYEVRWENGEVILSVHELKFDKSKKRTGVQDCNLELESQANINPATMMSQAFRRVLITQKSFS